jgi:hypothetical protein
MRGTDPRSVKGDEIQEKQGCGLTNKILHDIDFSRPPFLSWLVDQKNLNFPIRANIFLKKFFDSGGKIG